MDNRTHPPNSGRWLRIERVAAGLKIKDVAARMGRSPGMVSQYERQAIVAQSVVDAYLEAVMDLTRSES
jgi:transcriptional regulator with XRE-family HTH domain